MPTFEKSDKMQYVYIDNSGRGLAPRHLLAFAGATDFVEQKYGWSKPAATYPNEDAEHFLLAKWPGDNNDKAQLCKKNPFTLLPYIITEKDEIISSNSGMMTYLGLRYGFKTGVEAGQLDTQILAAMEKIQEFREGWLVKFFAMKSKEEFDEYVSDKPGFGKIWSTLKFFDDMIANNNKAYKYLFTNDKPSVADFCLLATICAMERWHSKLLDNYKNLQAWVGIMTENEGLKAEIEKEKNEAFFGDEGNMAQFGLSGIMWGVPGKMDPMY